VNQAHFNRISIFSLRAAYLVLIVIRCYFWPLEDMPEPGEIHLIHFTPGFVSTFPIQVFAFTCAQNVGYQLDMLGFCFPDSDLRTAVPDIQRSSEQLSK